MDAARHHLQERRALARRCRPAVALIALAVASIAALSPPARAAPPSGKALFAQHCEQCHRAVDSEDFGNIGPSLVDLRSRYPDDQPVLAIVRDETRRNPGTVMPPFGRHRILTDEEIRAIVGYLYSQRPSAANERGDH